MTFKSFFTIISICFMLISICKSDQNPTITLRNGDKITGSTKSTVGLNKPYNSYTGVPYALPPLGDLRFQDPQPLNRVPLAKNRVINATQFSQPCVQSKLSMDRTLGKLVGAEDCLYLNVYAPSRASNLPVLAAIFGDYFMTGNANLYGPDFFIDSDVVVVTINYRLGIFGFLSTDDNSLPGNYGIKDVVTALAWIQENIDKFGGNKDAVTLMGQGSGAAIVDYITLNTNTKGLYRNVIIQSMNSLSPISLNRIHMKVAEAIALGCGILRFNSATLLADLRKYNTTKLEEEAFMLYMADVAIFNAFASLPFAPTMQNKKIKGGFITSPMEDAMEKGQFVQVPHLIGYNSLEGGKYVTEFLSYMPHFKLKLDAFPWEYVPPSLNLNILRTGLEAVDIDVHYFNGLASSKKLEVYISDNLFVRPIVKEISVKSSKVPVYMYNYSFQGASENGKRKISGVSDGEELHYFWNMQSEAGQQLSADEQTTRKQSLTLWTNFIKFSNPTPTADPVLNNTIWPKAGQSNSPNTTKLKMLIIDKNLQVEDFSNANYGFWENLFNKHGNPPYSTY